MDASEQSDSERNLTNSFVRKKVFREQRTVSRTTGLIFCKRCCEFVCSRLGRLEGNALCYAKVIALILKYEDISSISWLPPIQYLIIKWAVRSIKVWQSIRVVFIHETINHLKSFLLLILTMLLATM